MYTQRQGRNGISVPKNLMENREQLTLHVIQAIKTLGYKEGAFEKPCAVYEKAGHPKIKLNRREGIVLYGTLEFKGNRFKESISFFNSLPKETEA